MALDLVQIRWQQIRQLEASQLIENENISLKKEIKSLQEKLAAASAAPPVVVADPNAGEAKNAIRRQCLNMRNMTMRLRSDIVNVKLTSVQQINALMSQKDQLKKAFDQYVSLYAIKEAQYEAMEYSRDQLQERLDEAKQELRDGVNTMSQEHDKLKLKYKNARSELIDAQAEINRLKDEARAMDEKYKALSDAKAESDSHYNVLNKEYLGMQAQIEKVRTEGETALNAALHHKAAMQESYEKILGELGYENEYLRKTCAEQEEQIAKLTNMLIGNKSHFARYVEVKTENLALQSKLEAVTKSTKRAGSLELASVMGAANSNGRSAAAAEGSGLPAHQKRNKASALSNAGSAIVSNGGGNSALGQAPAGHWSSAVRQPSPRVEIPPEYVTVSARPTKQPSAAPVIEHSNSGFISAGVQMMFPMSAAGSVAEGKRISPQTSPRMEPTRTVSKADSAASLPSTSTLAEPNVLPPPATVLKPARSSYAGGVARLSSPRSDSNRQGSAKSAYSATSEDGDTTPVGSAHGKLRGHALTDSRSSPMSSPRGIQAVGKTDSVRSVLADPLILPPPATALQPAVNSLQLSAISEGSSVISRGSQAAVDKDKSYNKKTLRFDPPAPAAAAAASSQLGVPGVKKVELTFGEVKSGKGRPLDRQVI